MNATATATEPAAPLVSLVVPFYNEGAGVDAFHFAIAPLLDELERGSAQGPAAAGQPPAAPVRFEIVAVDDGSRDDTLPRLLARQRLDPRLRVLELSRNFGKEAALTAGIDAARGDALIPIDADLQDPPALIPEMIAQWRRGAEVVLARRGNRDTDTWLKRKTAGWFYRLHNFLSDVPLPDNVGDFRLIDRVVVDALKTLPERQRFMKGLFAWVGFKTVTINYTRPARTQGESKFSGWKLWNFALEGITSFSSMPLKIWTYVGTAGAAVTSLYALYITLRTLVRGIDVPGYASQLVAVLFLGSLQLISIGVLGEYIGRIYAEVKARPAYLVRKTHEAGQK